MESQFPEDEPSSFTTFDSIAKWNFGSRNWKSTWFCYLKIGHFGLQRAVPGLQKDFFSPVSKFSIEKCRNHIFGWFYNNMKHKSHLELNCAKGYYYCIRFRSYMLRLIGLKCLKFLQEMSGILDTRIPPYCNSGPSELNRVLIWP